MAIALVQSVSVFAAPGSTTVTANFNNPTTAGNLVVAVLGWQKQTASSDITGVTLGGSADNFAEAVEEVAFQSPWSVGAAIWADRDCAGGQTAVEATGTGVDFNYGGIVAYEFSGADTTAPLDQVAKAPIAASTTTWSSGDTPTTAAADELYVGGFETWTTLGAVTAPSFTTLSAGGLLLAGYKISTDPSGSTPQYSGTQPSQSGPDAVVIATFKPVPPLTITTASLPSDFENQPYSQALAATGGATPYTWSISAGALPTGLSLSSGGTISGTPTATGTSDFTVKVTDANSQTATQPLSITVLASGNYPPGVTLSRALVGTVTPAQGLTDSVAVSQSSGTVTLQQKEVP